MSKGFNMRSKQTLLSHPRINMHSVSVCSYCTMYNPPLEVSCPGGLYKDSQLPFGEMFGKKEREREKKKAVHHDSATPDNDQIEDFDTDLLHFFLTCILKLVPMWGCEGQQPTLPFLPLPRLRGKRYRGRSALAAFN